MRWYLVGVLFGLVTVSDAANMPRAELDSIFVSVATHVLESHQLAPWQREGYTEGLKSRRWATVKQTIYYPSEGFDRGEGTRWGRGCSERVAASNFLREGTYLFVVWHHHKQILTQLRQVWDTGADWNDPSARRAKCDFWVDLWVPKIGYRGLGNDQIQRNMAVIEYPTPSRSKHWRGKRLQSAQWH